LGDLLSGVAVPFAMFHQHVAWFEKLKSARAAMKRRPQFYWSLKG
jgi:hypothetical protein